MNLDVVYTLFILLVAIILFVTEWLRVDVVALGVVVALMLTGVLSPPEALAGFSNSAVLTIAALFIVGGSVMQTGLAGIIGERILKIAGKDETRLMIVIMLSVAFLSGFMSDTGTVAVLLPAIIALASRAKISPSRLLIPLSFGSLLGGAMTLIGTAPNIIVSDLLRKEGLETFTFFSFTPMGLILLVTGIIFMLTIGRKILPNHQALHADLPVTKPEELIHIYHLDEHLYYLKVEHPSALIGLTIAESNLRHDFYLTIMEIQRQPAPQASIKFGTQSVVLQSEKTDVIRPQNETVIQTNDLLLVEGNEEAIHKAMAHWNLSLLPKDLKKEGEIISQESGIAEVLVRPRSAFIGKTLSDIRFGNRFQLHVISIRRQEMDEGIKPSSVVLKAGDILLVQGLWKDILDLKKSQRPNFVVLGQPEIEGILGTSRYKKAPIALIVMLGMLILIVLNITAVSTASIFAALLMVLTGCLTMDEAYEVIDWKSIVLIAGMLPMATALESVGLIDNIAITLTNTLGDAGPLIVMGSLFLLTATFTQVLSNTATTVIVAPIGLATAIELGVEPYAFLMAIAIAASMAFASPVASPANTLVMGAGHYRFSDYMKIGIPLILIMMVITVIVLPFIFPF
ncbi:MAG: SLC13 family permease [Phototrophicaceae bacterium]